MESIQAFLTSSIVVIWYFGCTLIIFDFLIGLPALMQQTARKCNTQSMQIDMESAKLRSSETLYQGLNSILTRPFTNEDEVTIQYLGIVGADIEDFESITDARKFLDENAPWTIETDAAPAKQLASNADSNISVQSATEKEEKLTCAQVQAEFAKLGWRFEKYRCGHNRYRVNVDGLHHRFKTLQDALDWLNLSRRLIRVVVR